MTDKDRDETIPQKDARPQYQKPEIIEFDETHEAHGPCHYGSVGQGGTCRSGGSASGRCINGALR